MRKIGLLGTSAIRSVAFVGLVAASITPALAQDGAGNTDDPATLQSEQEIESGEDASAGAQGEETITVTGSRIRRPNLDSNVPVTSIAGESFIQQGDTNIGDALNELPQLASTFAQQNPGLGIGIAGLNLLDLRQLGPQRTLVLVNGRRHVAADITNNAASVDINTIPNDLIERVDIVTGGQSAIYGSDAIAGVVNFVLRRDFEGAQIRGNASVAEEGYAGEQYVSAMVGKNFGDNRGNITLHAEYSNQERVFGSQVPRYRQVNGLLTVDVDSTPSDGNPDRVFFRDVRSATNNRYGLVPVTQAIGGAAPCGTSGAANAAPFNCVYIFDAAGRLTPQTGTRVGTTLNGSFIGGNGQTGREDTLLSILPEVQRYNVNLLGHYQFSDAFEVFVEAKYARADAIGNNASPTFTQGGSFTENGLGSATPQRERFRLDNPFLNPADRAFLTNAFLTSGCDPTITGAACAAATSPTSATRLSATEIAQITAGTYRFPIGKQFLDIGIRDEVFKRETYRGVVGLRGTFNDDWSYEVSANYGVFKQDNTNRGFVDRQRFLLSLDAGIDPANPGAGIQCRAKFDPAARVPFQSAILTSAQNAFIAARLASDIAACVPYNPFGAGGAQNQAASNYFVYTNNDSAKIDQLVISGFLSGDSSQAFELPGGPVRFAIGGEYRREDAEYINDPIALQGVTNAVVLGTATPAATKVKEAFGEIQLPILKDVPFFEELTVTAAGRVSDYNTIGTVYAYNAGVEWAPIRDVRFRANYGRSVRAPNQSETAFPVVPNFAPGFADPCSGSQIATGSATRAANCLTDLGSDLLASISSLGTPSLPVLSGSNPDLAEEKSDSYTVGVVIQPRMIPGLSFSADYFDIKVKNVIVALGAQAIANNCYDSPTLDNPFCALFERYRGPNPGPSGEIPGQILGNSLRQVPLNFASRIRRGIDFELSYRTRLSDKARLSTNVIYVHNLDNSNFQDPQNPDFENRVLGELGTPKDEFRWDTDLAFNDFTFGYQMRYIGPQYVSVYEDFNELQGRPAENPDFADTIKYPKTFYHNIRLQWDIPGVDGGESKFRLYGGVDNLLNTFPPLGLTGTGTGGAGGDRGTGNASIFEALGRTFYAGVRARF
ncbi:TonB-dependent receptor domain-containing protein [Allosphingosinicella deserti]|uniref:TonB-dependent receptor n=1 Tax=Allosphingosinicella deserti TaxID=2116704 RepID=A0A2P7QZZ0_9SPHN|nr:TonB-dependent receptor [Sphingomonas deserti]PSJ43537.1 TonB-dependent receptor [Sphingomonas deserti]